MVNFSQKGQSAGLHYRGQQIVKRKPGKDASGF
jgi:hypothetical protein